MPLSKYYKGDGKNVMKNMKKVYGDKDAKKVFYATANKYGLDPSDETKEKMFSKRRVRSKK